MTNLSQPIKVFISYSHQDDAMRASLVKHMGNLKLRGLIEDWHDRNMLGGDRWRSKIAGHLQAAQLILLLVSKDFMNSKECLAELQSAMQLSNAGKTRVIPILLHSFDWEGAPFSKFQMLPQNGVPIANWGNPDDAYVDVVKGIRKALTEIPAGLSLASQASRNKPLYYHPYPATQDFTGRQAERAMLTQWFKDTQGAGIFILDAIGGMGKSALAWHWVTKDLSREGIQPDGLFWWSFYESDASFDNFTRQALAYFAGPEYYPDPGSGRPWWHLVNALGERSCLLVLDGVERCLRAYGRTHSAYQGDNFQPDPENQFRECVSPDMQRFLVALLAPGKPKVLLTTRLSPRELDNREGCICHKLKPMTKEDALAYFRARGVTESKATYAEVDFACSRYGYNPLAITLLIGAVLKNHRFMGDIHTAARSNMKLVPPEPGRSHEILEKTYNALSQPLQNFFSRLAAFRSPMDLDAAKVVFEEPGMMGAIRRALGFTSETSKRKSLMDAQTYFQELVDRGLLLFDPRRKRYDMHPIVRQYAYDRLTDKTGVHTRLGNYFSAVPLPNIDQVARLEDLIPVIELYHHMIGSGKYDQAVRLFVERLSIPLVKQFYAFNLIIELLQGMFLEVEEHPSLLKDQENVAWAGSLLVMAYVETGQLRTTTTLLKRLVAYDLDRAKKSPIAKHAQNFQATAAGELIVLSNIQAQLGELKEAEENARLSVALLRETGTQEEKIKAHVILVSILNAIGKSDDEAMGFETWEGFYSPSVLVDQDDSAFVSAIQAMTLLQQLPENPGTQMDAPEYQQELLEAEKQLVEAISQFRATNRISVEVEFLPSLAKLRYIQGDYDEAIKVAQDGLTLAVRCELLLKQVDLHNFLARCYLQKALLSPNAAERKTMLTQARAEAESGKARAWCNGPPYSYKPGLEKSESLLEEIRMAEFQG